MKRHVVLILTFVALLLILAALDTPTRAKPPAQATAVAGIQGRVTATDGLRVRTQPNNTAPSLVTLPLASRVTIIGRNVSGTWLVIRTEAGVTGWAGAAFVQYQGTLNVPVVADTADLSATTPAPDGTSAATPGAEDCPTAEATTTARTGVPGRITAVDGLRLRKEPNTTSEIIATLRVAQRVTVLGRNTSGQWLFIQDELGNTGWGGQAFILVDGRVSALPVTDEAGAAAGSAPSTAPGEGDPCPTEEATDGATPAATAARTGVPGRVNSIQGLQIRTQPAVNSPSLGTLRNAQRITVLGRNTSGTWLFIQDELGVTGWVGSAYVLVDGRVSALPVVDEAGATP
jgi:uncharacterized protein YgiM (DUF1202 family)